MTSQLSSYALLVLLGGCFGAHPTTPAAAYQRSRILTFKRTAIMDTVTAVLDGQVASLCNQQPLPASVQLTSPGKTYRTVATPDGRFRFFHISSSTYRITVAYPTYDKLAADTVHLGTGDASTIEIGLGCRTASSR
jgi:hypothetical protein